MLKFIITGDKPKSINSDIEDLDRIISKVKKRKEVTTAYMRQWDRELSIKREAREEYALDIIRFDIEENIPKSSTIKRLKRMGYEDDHIAELFSKVESEEKILTQ